MQEMKLQEFKSKKPADLVAFAESLEVENASTMRKQELMFAILKKFWPAQEVEIIGEGVVESPAGRLRLPPVGQRELPAGSR
jgi:transcription termination factor Rho